MTDEKPKNPVGRPSDYSQELADKICELLADGKSLRKVCENDWAPNKSSIFRWLRTIPEFCDQYERAKQESADSFADDMADIADDGRNDWMESNDPDNPGYKANGEHVQRTRLRLDTRKWLAAKLKPKKYGDSQRIEHTITSVSDQMRALLDAGTIK